MGKINYTLLNASALNASRLNMTGETGKPGGGAGGYWPAGTPAAIRRSAVLWYDIAKQGATNETMAANPVLKDLSGNGHDATCYNFGWEGMSGVGGYIKKCEAGHAFIVSNAKFEIINSYKIVYKRTGNNTGDNDYFHNGSAFQFNCSKDEIIPSYKVRISGLEEGWTMSYYFQGATRVDTVEPLEDIEGITNGIVEVPSFTNGYYPQLRFDDNVPYDTDCNVIIEFLPQYPGALVSDGVDDYCVAEGLPILTPERGYTLITKREIQSTGSFVSNRVIDGSSGAFVFELKVNRTDSFGAQNLIPRTTSLISYQTKSMYNGVEISYGTANGVDKLLLFRLNPVRMDYMCQSALYSLLLFDRDLTAEEIEWVKNNLIENNTEV